MYVYIYIYIYTHIFWSISIYAQLPEDQPERLERDTQ